MFVLLHKAISLYGNFYRIDFFNKSDMKRQAILQIADNVIIAHDVADIEVFLHLQICLQHCNSFWGWPGILAKFPYSHIPHFTSSSMYVVLCLIHKKL